MIQPKATMMPPNAVINFGPRTGPRTSTIHPWMGVSQVSIAMKTLNATWIAAMDQPCALLMGLTNNVQPYWRLAINTMQMMTKINWRQRDALAVVAAVGAAVVIEDIF